jgi:hypothetical protein
MGAPTARNINPYPERRVPEANIDMTAKYDATNLRRCVIWVIAAGYAIYDAFQPRNYGKPITRPPLMHTKKRPKSQFKKNF